MASYLSTPDRVPFMRRIFPPTAAANRRRYSRNTEDVIVTVRACRDRGTSLAGQICNVAVVIDTSS